MNDIGASAERAFFRSEFRDRTLVVAIGAVGAADARLVDDTVATVRRLTGSGCRVIVVAPDAGPLTAERLAAAFAAVPSPSPESDADLAQLWSGVEDRRVGVVGTPDTPATVAAGLACRLGVTKLVLTDDEGGWGVSFASRDDLADGSAVRPRVAAAVRQALDGGVAGVNVCRLGDLDTELFTFDGCGTLFTRHGYVQVSPLGADDLAKVAELVSRGVAEGYLRPRSRVEVIRLALSGLGARVTPSGQLAGFGALEVDRYAADGLAEVACLYTVNRYSGEGVGGQLVAGLLEVARAAGSKGVFACTVSDRAASLFERSGFRPVPLDHVPDSKWTDYDLERRKSLTALWFDLGAGHATEQAGGVSP